MGRLPYGGLNQDRGYSLRGFFEIVGHEFRREEAYRRGYDAYYAEAEQRKRGVVVCRQSEGEAKLALETYLRTVDTLAKVAFEVYTGVQQASVDDENNHQEGAQLNGNTMFDRYSQTHTVDEPPAAQWPGKPTSNCNPSALGI